MRYLSAPFAATLAAFAVGTAQGQAHTPYQGAWQGPFLFYVVHPDFGAQGKPAVHSGVIQIDATGAVHGHVPDAACTMTGSSIDYVSAANASIDLTLRGCTDARFNGHFSGKLITNPVLKYGSLRLSSMRSLDEGTAQVSAVMRR